MRQPFVHLSWNRFHGVCLRAIAVIVLGQVLSSPAVRAQPGKDPDTKKSTLRDMLDRTAQSVVLITTQSSTGDEVGQGSGFVVDGRGWVATNYHVLRGAAGAVVQFKDGSKYKIKGIRAFDADVDLAILAMDKPPAKIQAMVLGPDTPPRVGEDVIAIGHPRGLSFTVTTGIVSAVRKRDQFPKEIAEQLAGADQTWLQTNAAIAPGNSGGPLLDGQGRVIGINTWIIGNQNYAFAIHVRQLRALLKKPSKDLLPLSIPRYSRDVANPFAALEPRVEEMLKDYSSAQRQFGIDLAQAADEAAARRIFAAQNPGPKYARRFYEMANGERKTTVALQALVLACRLDDEGKNRDWRRKALARLTEDHATDKGIYHALPIIVATADPAAADFLRQIIAKHSDRRTRGLSTYLLAQLLAADHAHESEATRLLERCASDYKDLSLERGVTLGDVAKPLLYRIRYLSVGKTAPEIEGADVDGKKSKLSDYRGKIVLLDFFADWCPHCERMYPHERDLVKRYASRPFALVGVNCDKGADTLRQLIANKKVTWRCWWDGTGQHIMEQWQVDGFPTLYLLDDKGVIREIFNGRPDEKKLDEAIERLLPRPKKP